MAQPAERLGALASREQGLAERQIGLRRPGINLERPAPARQRLFRFPLGGADLAEVVPPGSQVGAGFQGLLQMRGGVLVFSLRREQPSEVVLGLDAVRVLRQELAEQRGGVAEPPLAYLRQ